MARGEPTLISSVQRALRLVDAVALSSGPVPAKKLASLTGQPLPTTYHLLRTLLHEGYLSKTEDGYLLGDRLTTITTRGRGQQVTGRVRPTLRMLHKELSAATYLASYADGEINILDVVDSPQAPRVDLWVGVHDSGHATALGKCILSCLPTPDRDDYLSRHQLHDLTPHTITDERELLAQLQRTEPYALDRQEYALGTVCVAAPILAGGVSGAIGISLSTHKLPSVLEQRHSLTRAARRIELALATLDEGL